MSNLPKVLVASPTYEVMKYCEREFIDSLKKLDYPNYDILIIDNSKNKEYFNHLKKSYSDIKIIYDNINESKNILRLISSRNKIINYAIENNYDFILMMDSDVIPPKDTIKELLKSNKDIVSGLYYNYFIVDGKTKWLPVAWTALSEKEFEEIKQKVNLPDFIKSHIDLRVHLTEEEADSNTLIEVVITSAGCLLISRRVFSSINYSLLDTKEYNSIRTGDEISFLLEARKLGFNIFCNTKIKCEHLVKDKFEKDSKGVYHHPLYKN